MKIMQYKLKLRTFHLVNITNLEGMVLMAPNIVWSWILFWGEANAVPVG